MSPIIGLFSSGFWVTFLLLRRSCVRFIALLIGEEARPIVFVLQKYDKMSQWDDNCMRVWDLNFTSLISFPVPAIEKVVLK